MTENQQLQVAGRLKPFSPLDSQPQTGGSMLEIASQESTTLQTPSPLTKLKQESVCHCGSTSFVKFKTTYNCKQCGVFMVQAAEGFVFGLNLKEDVCPHGNALVAQERLESLQQRQQQIHIVDKIHREMALQMITKGASKFKMSYQTVQLAITYFDLIAAKNTDLRQNLSTTWQKTTITCLILACKFLERDDNVPLIQDLIRILMHYQVQAHSQGTGQGSNRSQTRAPPSISYEEVCSYELILMERLEWDLFKVTPQNFLDNYFVSGLVLSSDSITVDQCDTQELQSYRSGQTKFKTPTSQQKQTVKIFRQPGRKTLQKVKRIAKKFMQLACEQLELFSGFTPEAVAISTVLCARRACKLDESTSDKYIEQLFNRRVYEDAADIRRCCLQMESLDSDIMAGGIENTHSESNHQRQMSNLLSAASQRTGRTEYNATAIPSQRKVDSQLLQKLKQLKRQDSSSSLKQSTLKSVESRLSFQQIKIPPQYRVQDKKQQALEHQSTQKSVRSTTNFLQNLKQIQKQTFFSSSAQKESAPPDEGLLSQKRSSIPTKEGKPPTKTVPFKVQSKSSLGLHVAQETSSVLQQQSQVYLDFQKEKVTQPLSASEIVQDTQTTREKLVSLLTSQASIPLTASATATATALPEETKQQSSSRQQVDKQNFITKNIENISKITSRKMSASAVSNRSLMMSQERARPQSKQQVDDNCAAEYSGMQKRPPAQPQSKFRVVLKQFADSKHSQQSAAAEYMPLTSRSKLLQQNQSQKQIKSVALSSLSRQRSLPKQIALDSATKRQSPKPLIPSSTTSGKAPVYQSKQHLKRMSIDSSLKPGKALSKLVSPVQGKSSMLVSVSSTGRSTVLSNSSSKVQQPAKKPTIAKKPPAQQSIRMLQRPPSGINLSQRQGPPAKQAASKRGSSFLCDYMQKQSLSDKKPAGSTLQFSKNNQSESVSALKQVQVNNLMFQ